MQERTGELFRANEQLMTEIDEDKRSEESFWIAYAENKQLRTGSRLKAQQRCSVSTPARFAAECGKTFASAVHKKGSFWKEHLDKS